MNRIDRRTWWLILALFAGVIGLALLSDLLRLAVGAGTEFRTRPGFGPPWWFGAGGRTRGFGTAVRALAGITAAVGTGSIVLLFAPRRLLRTAATLEQQGLVALAIGFAGLLGAILLAALALISFVGAPFVPLIGLLVLSAIALGVLAVALRLGQWLRSRVGGEINPTVDLIAGVLVIALGVLVPVVGGLVLLAVVCWGVGAVVISRAGSEG